MQALADGQNGVDGLDGANGVAVAPDGAHVYVTSVLDNAVAAFSRDAATGALAFVGTAPAGGAFGLSVSPDGASVYVSGFSADRVYAFSRDAATGALALVQTLADGQGGVSGIDGPRGSTVSPDGRTVYVAGNTSDAVAVFSRDAATGLLTFTQAPASTLLNSARSVAVSPDGAHVYAAALSADALSVYARDAATGALTFVEAQVEGANGVTGLNGAQSVVVSPDGRTVYVASGTSDAVVAFSRDRATGALAFLGGAFDEQGGVTTLNAANGVALSPDGAFAYAVANSDDALTAFRLGAVQAAVFNPSAAASDGAGWRLLAPPVTDLRVDDLARINLVQGVAAGSPAARFPAQYAGAGANLLTSYDGTAYGAAQAADEPLVPGRGLFWYWYDAAIRPASVPAELGTGTSRSVELSDPTFALAAVGPFAGADVSVTLGARAAGQSTFHLLGNPFVTPMAVSGISVAGGTLAGGAVQVWDPALPGYVTRTAANGDGLAEWQGALGSVVPAQAGGAPVVTYAAASRVAAGSVPFIGRGADPPQVRFRVTGVLASGARVGDAQAQVRFLDGAEAGDDALDAPLAPQPGRAFAVLSPVVDGRRVALDSRPPGAAAALRLAFATSEAGTFTLAWATEALDGWHAVLTDTHTGETTDLARASETTFTAAEAQDGERFALSLTPAGTVAAEGAAEARGLDGPFPNPASGRAALTLRLDAPQTVRAVVVDALGREVAVLLDAEASGTVRLGVDAARLAPGVYVVRVQGATFSEARRLTVVR